MSRRISGFTLELRGSHEEMQRLLDVFWKEMHVIDIESRDTRELRFGPEAWPMIRSAHTITGTVTVQEDVASG